MKTKFPQFLSAYFLSVALFNAIVPLRAFGLPGSLGVLAVVPFLSAIISTWAARLGSRAGLCLTVFSAFAGLGTGWAAYRTHATSVSALLVAPVLLLAYVAAASRLFGSRLPG